MLYVQKDQFPLIYDDPDTCVKVISCRPCVGKGMIEFVELVSHSPIKKALDKIRASPMMIHTVFKTFDESRASGFITVKDSLICAKITSMGGFCKSCPLELGSTMENKVKWKVVFEDNSSFNSFLEKLEENGIHVETVSAGDLKENGLLTLREEQVVRLANERGYFQFPRKTSLRKISASIGISPSTLDEILRRAEQKIVREHIKKPNGATEEKQPNGSFERSLSA